MASSHHSQNAVESNVLIRRATWCGVVFSLALVLTFLNFLPPVGVQYHVRSKAVVSEARLAKLRNVAMADRQTVKHGETKPIQLLSVKVLDLAVPEPSAELESANDKVVLIEIGTLWTHRCTAERHFKWLKDASQLDSTQLSGVHAATQARLARWELEAAQHYKSQFDYLSAKPCQLVDSSADATAAAVADSGAATSENSANQASAMEVNPAGAGEHQAFQLASYSEPAETSTASEKTPGEEARQTPPVANSEPARGNELNEEFERQLTEQIAIAQAQVEQAEATWREVVDRSSGALQVAGLPVIAPRSTSIPFWMAASILILGLAAGSTTGWFQYRSYSSGAYQAERVAEQLTLDAIPVVGRMVLAKAEYETCISGNASTFVARAGRRLSRIAEYALTFWVVIAACRFFLDSVWRDVLINSPLAALGRMLSGMP